MNVDEFDSLYEKVRSAIGTAAGNYDFMIERELAKYGITKENGLDRVQIDRGTNEPTHIYPEICPGTMLDSKWYVDGKLAFTIRRSVDIIQQSECGVMMTVRYYIV